MTVCCCNDWLLLSLWSADTPLPPRTCWWGHEECSRSAAGGYPTKNWAQATTSLCSSCRWPGTTWRHDKVSPPRPRFEPPSKLWVGAERGRGHKDDLGSAAPHTFIKPVEQTRSQPSHFYPRHVPEEKSPPLFQTCCLWWFSVRIQPFVVLLFPVYVHSKPGHFSILLNGLYISMSPLLHVAPVL